MAHANKILALISSAMLLCGGALADDVEGGKDHPLVGRFEGATLTQYDSKAFDEAKLLQAPADREAFGKGLADLTAPAWLAVEGKVTRLAYDLPENRSSLEVMRNHEAALKAKGFTPVFSCVDEACVSDRQREESTSLGSVIFHSNAINFGLWGPVRYVLMKSETPSGTVHVSLIVGMYLEQAKAYFVITEAKPMDTGKINFLKASDLEKAIDSTGKVDLYGIFFDFDKDVVKAESKPTLDEIAKLLTAKPELKLKVIGHTDNKGEAAYNLALSQRRAAAVANALQTGYSVAADRLIASGEGAARPVAANDTDANRAKNRRVELAK